LNCNSAVGLLGQFACFNEDLLIAHLSGNLFGHITFYLPVGPRGTSVNIACAGLERLDAE
jgi:hypothetical protein